ncbi:hypothetical protein GCM10023340_26280 [Nocardioides marinquilinus]|uniref:Uncharacterized protein n=1 Tax=Nocardioides marinquilinus TaxID=1210400 RepID=A0ABP9PPG4_9ACTN
MRVARAAFAGVALVVVGLWLRDFLPASEDDLEGRVDDLPAVLDVVATESSGDDGLPFPLMRIGNGVDVVLRTDSDARAVAEVLDAYADDVDDGDVDAVSVSLRDRDATLVACCDGWPDDAAVTDFLAAAHDPVVRSYSRVVRPEGSDVEVELEPLAFADVVARLDAHRGVGPAGWVRVGSGGFSLTWNDGLDAERLARLEARTELVIRLDDELGLAEAHVSDRGPLALRLDDPDDELAARRLLAGVEDRAVVGTVRLREWWIRSE